MDTKISAYIKYGEAYFRHPDASSYYIRSGDTQIYEHDRAPALLK